MPKQIGAVQYFSATEVAQQLNVSRQTLWRWRKEGRIPSGRRFRDRQIFFTVPEVECIREYGNHLEPIHPQGDLKQLHLFTRESAHHNNT
jgi:excisionase family DNA binding protein